MKLALTHIKYASKMNNYCYGEEQLRQGQRK